VKIIIFVFILGGLHTQMAALKTVGDVLESSGWATALVNAGVTSAGKADSMLHALHVARTRYAHQVSASALYISMQHAYDQNVEKQALDLLPVHAFNDWVGSQCNLHPPFKDWHSILELQ
jgi:hypothetical protein